MQKSEIWIVQMASFRTGVTCGRNFDVFSVTEKQDGPVMVWTAVCYNRQVSLTLTRDRQATQHYT